MSDSVHHNIIDVDINECMEIYNILNTYCKLLMRLQKLWTNSVITLFILKKIFLHCCVCDQVFKISQGKVLYVH